MLWPDMGLMGHFHSRGGQTLEGRVPPLQLSRHQAPCPEGDPRPPTSSSRLSGEEKR